MKCSKLFGSLARGFVRSPLLHRRVRAERTVTDDWLHPPGIPVGGLAMCDRLGEGPLQSETDYREESFDPRSQ